MNQKQRDGLPELLAPAGSEEALIAAINAGADAVYLGGSRFGARQFAANFDEDSLVCSVARAHAQNVAVYVTVNTLIHDRELVDVARYLLVLCRAGVDAVLVQDFGVAALARWLVPDLQLHASTQMTVYTIEGVRWAAAHGFSRVVLARELSLAEVTAIATAAEQENLNVGVEVFLHGALCYSYSGQCLLSSVIGGRSGNRGSCAQPCRKQYTLLRGEADPYGRPVQMQEVQDDEQYLLSPRDLACYPHLDLVARSPITSLKIEGRMKSPEYVATVVGIYRAALDAIRAGDWKPDDLALQRLLMAFNRGFTGGYLLGARNRSLMGRDRPDNRGLFVGTVSESDFDREEVTVALEGETTPEAGDGLVIISPDGEECGLVLRGTPWHHPGEPKVSLPVQDRIATGSMVYLTRNAAYTKVTRRQISDNVAHPPSTIPLSLSFSFDEQRRPHLSGTALRRDNTVVQVSVIGDEPFLEALEQPLSSDRIREQLTRTGGTPFMITDLVIDNPGTLFGRSSALNKLRRDLLSAATDALVCSYHPSEEAVASAEARGMRFIDMQGQIEAAEPMSTVPMLILFADTLEAVIAAARAGCRLICFEPKTSAPCGCTGTLLPITDQLTQAIHLLRTTGAKLIWKWPQITRSEFLAMAREILATSLADDLSGVMVEGIGAAAALQEMAPTLPLYGGQGLNIWNHCTVSALAGFQMLTLSGELSGEEIAELTGAVARLPSTNPRPHLALIVQGSAGALVTEDCPVSTSCGCTPPHTGSWAIRDQKGEVFPLVFDGSCRTRIVNAVETSLIDHLISIAGIGITEVLIDARGRTPLYAEEMVRLYLRALDLVVLGGRRSAEELAQIKVQVKRMSLGGITTGQFLRGLKEL